MGGIHSSANTSLVPGRPLLHPKNKFLPSPPSPFPPQARQQGQLGGCYLMPGTAPNRPKPDAGHLGHLGRSTPIPPRMSTRDSPLPECLSAAGSRAPHTRP